MEIKRIVYHDNFKFGIVVEDKNKFSRVYFNQENTIKEINDDYLTIVDDLFVKEFYNDLFKRKFDDSTLKKGFEYQINDAIKKISYDDFNNVVSAVVSGTYDYHCSITLNNNHTFTYRCDCPVNGRCKHLAALSYELSKIFKELINFNEGQTLVKKELSANLKYAYSNVRYASYALASEIIAELKENDDQYLITFLDYLQGKEDHGYYSYNQEIPIYAFLTYNNEIRQRIHNLPSYSFTIGANLEKYLRRAKAVSENALYGVSNMHNSRLKHVNLFYIVNERYLECIKYNIQKEFYNIDNDAVYYCCEKIEYNDSLLNLFYEIDNQAIYLFKPLLNKFPLDKKVAIYENCYKNLIYNLSEIKDFPEEVKYRLLKHVNVENEKQFKEILKKELIIDEKHSFDNAAIILNLYDQLFTPSDKTFNLLVEYANKLEDSQLFVDYLNAKYAADRKTRRYFGGECLNDKQFDFNKFPYNSFIKYFRVDMDFGKYDRKVRTYFNLYDADNELLVRIYELNSGYYILEYRFDNKPNGILSHFLVYYCKNVLKNDYDNGKKEVQAEIDKEIEKERCGQASYDMIKLSKAFVSSNLRLRDDKKAHLEYRFTYDRDNIYLGFKIGIDKTYVVKDPYDFLNYFNTKEIVEYGKSLRITHSLDNLVEEDKKIMSFILKSHFSQVYDNRYLYVNKGMFDELMNMLKGRNILFNDQSYKVRLNETKRRIFIDKDCVLCLEMEGIEHFSIIASQENCYIFDEDKMLVDLYKGNSALLNFANDYNNLNISSIKKQFKNDVYAYFNDEIEVAEELKEDFKLSTVLIKAYFDYEDKKILLRKEFYKEDKLVDEKALDQNDLLRVQMFEQYISSLGFIDNELEDDNKVLGFFYLDFDDLRKLCEVYLSDSIQNKVVSSFTPATVRISYDGVIMKAFLEDSIYSNEELEEILAALKHKKKYVLLNDNKIINLDNKESNDFYSTVDDLKLNTKKLNDENSISLVQSLKAFAHENNCSIDTYLTKMIDEIANFKNSEIEIPKINGELRKYQEEGYKWLAILSKYNVGGILADDMGLGKTIQIITLISGSKNKLPSLIVCPKTLVFNWKNEFMRFAPEIEVREIFGNKDERSKIINNIKAKEKVVYISSYDSLRNDIEDYKATFDYTIIDEAQYIKNVKAQKTISVKNIKAAHKFALTGTPIENNLIDLWSIFDFIMPGYFEGITNFKNNCEDEQYIQMISKRIAPFVLRRVKKDVLKDLPEKYETILSVEMGEKQRKVYDAFKNEVNKKLEGGSRAFDVLPYLMRLRQICVNPKMFAENYDGEVAKMDLLSTLIDDYLEKGHKILIFSQFVKALNEVEVLLKQKKVAYFMITGETDGKKRIEMAQEFNGDSLEKVMLISLKAGGTGLNLVGADTVIHLDPWWNIAAENQASDRSHRIGQKNNVEVIKIICEKSIEQRVIELQNIKKDLIDKVISENDETVMTSSLENIKYLLD